MPEFDQLEEIDLSEYGQAVGSSESMLTITPNRGARRRASRYQQAPLSPWEADLLKALPDKAPSPAREVVETPEATGGGPLIRGDRGRIERSRTIAATLDIPFSEAYDAEASYTKKLEARAPDFFKTAKNNWVAGIGDMNVLTGRGLELAGFAESGRDLIEFGRYMQNAYLPPEKPETFTYDKLLDPAYLATTPVRSMPAMVGLILPTLVGAYAAGVGAVALGLGTFGRVVVSAVAGTAIGVPLESAFEAADQYGSALDRGVPEPVARQQANDVFKLNLPKGGVDLAQFALAFTPIRNIGRFVPKVLAARVAATAVKFGGVALMEGAEESYQAAVQQSVSEGMTIMEAIKRQNPEMKESQAIGAIFGLGLAGAGSVMVALTERVTEGMPDKVAETYQVAEQAALARGLEPAAAQIEALDAVAATPEGKAHVEKVMGELKDIAEGKPIEPVTQEDMQAAIEEIDKQEFTLGEQVEPELIGEDVLEAIASEQTSSAEVLGLEPDVSRGETENFLISEDTYQAALASLKAKTGGFHAGVDPTALGDLAKIGAYHIERGLRSFAGWADMMVDRFGDVIQPHLQAIWDQAQALVAKSDTGSIRAGPASFYPDSMNEEVAKKFMDTGREVSYASDQELMAIAKTDQSMHRAIRDEASRREDIRSGRTLALDRIFEVVGDPGRSQSVNEDRFFISKEAYDDAIASLQKTAKGFHAGIDPATVLKSYAVIGAYHIEHGVRNIAELTKIMVDKFGDWIVPRMEEIWTEAQKLVGAGGITEGAKPLEASKFKATGVQGFIQDHIEMAVKGNVELTYKGKTYSNAVREGKNLRLIGDPDVVVRGNAILSIEEVVPFDVPGEEIADRPLSKHAAEFKAMVEQAEGATTPTKQVKHQIRLTTGQERVAKAIREDVALSAAFKKAEQASRIAYREGGKDALEAAKADMRDVIIKAKVKAEIFGFREGFKVSEKLTRKELTQAFNDDMKEMEETRKAIVEIIQENLPPEMRGKYLDAIISKLTEKKQNDLLDRIATMKDTLTKKELLAELATLQRPSASVNVQYQKRIKELLGDINTRNVTAKTRENVERLLKFAEEEGMPTGVSRKTLALVQRLEGRQASEMSIEDLKALTDAARHLTAMGKLKQQLLKYKSQREQKAALEKLLATTHDLDWATKDPLAQGALSIYIDGLNAIRVTEMMDGWKDGENGKLARDLFHGDLAAQWDVVTVMEAAVQEMVDAGISEPTEEQEGRIITNIRNREGAFTATLKLMEKYGYQEIPALTEAEEKLILILKKYSTDSFGDRIAAVFEEQTNRVFPKKDDRILPLYYEGEIQRSPDEVILDESYRMTSPEHGFTIERVEGVKKMPRSDILAMFEEGINAQLWYLRMQPILNDVKHLVKSKEYVSKAGEVASNWWENHLDIVARRGSSAKAVHGRFQQALKAARNNMTQGILGYRLSTILVQPAAVFDAMGHMQAKFGTAATAEVMAEFAKSWVVPGYAKEYMDADPTHALKLRNAGEVAVQEVLQKVGRKRSVKAAFIRNGMSLIRKNDVVTAAGVQQAIEKVLTKHGIPDAAREAAVLMDMSQSSSDVSLRPHVLSWGEGAKTWLTFQTFALNQWGLIAHDMIVKGLVKGEGAGRISAMVGLGMIVAGIVAVQTGREYLWELISRRSLKTRSLIQDALYAIPSSIPVFGGVFSAASGRRGNDIPVTKVINDGLRVIAQPSWKAALRSAEAGLIIGAGIPGTSMAFDLVEGMLFPEKKKESEKIKARSIKASKD